MSSTLTTTSPFAFTPTTSKPRLIRLPRPVHVPKSSDYAHSDTMHLHTTTFTPDKHIYCHYDDQHASPTTTSGPATRRPSTGTPQAHILLQTRLLQLRPQRRLELSGLAFVLVVFVWVLECPTSTKTYTATPTMPTTTTTYTTAPHQKNGATHSHLVFALREQLSAQQNSTTT